MLGISNQSKDALARLSFFSQVLTNTAAMGDPLFSNTGQLLQSTYCYQQRGLS